MKKIILYTMLFIFFTNNIAFSINRQDLGNFVKDYPDGEILQIYIPYETDVAINGELFHIKLIKLFEEQVSVMTPFMAKNVFYSARLMLYMKWKDFAKKLSYNEESIRKAIIESVKNSERLKNYKKKWFMGE